MTPLSTSRKDVSTSLAKNGAAAITRGGIVPSTPVDTPIIMRVKGMRARINIIKGTERMMFTTSDNTLYMACSTMELDFEKTNSMIPSGSPIINVNNVANPIICRVSIVAPPISFQSIEEKSIIPSPPHQGHALAAFESFAEPHPLYLQAHRSVYHKEYP